MVKAGGSDGGEHSMTGTLDPPSGRVVVMGDPGSVAAASYTVVRAPCGERGVSGDGSGGDKLTAVTKS